jgi:hypothetical protein
MAEPSVARTVLITIAMVRQMLETRLCYWLLSHRHGLPAIVLLAPEQRRWLAQKSS